jgi:hypothetical protein
MLNTCSYGFDYVKISEKLIVGGVLVKNAPQTTKVKSKNIKKYSQNVITMAMIETLARNIKDSIQEENDLIEEEKNKIIDEYVKTECYKTDFLAKLKPEMFKGLSFVHDYKQINTQISQNINVIIEQHYVGESIEDKIDIASEEEKAIYNASKLLSEKLNVAKFLLQPEWLENRELCNKFRFHGAVLKYRRIYTPLIDEKRIKVSWFGKSSNEIVANTQAVSVIPHTFIDNAVKYSPEGGRIEISTYDREDKVEFSVSSHGPRLHPHERNKLFKPFYRGERARKLQEEGAGYGLYTAQLIAKLHLGTEISFEQDEYEDKNHKGMHWTTFRILVPPNAIIW